MNPLACVLLGAAGVFLGGFYFGALWRNAKNRRAYHDGYWPGWVAGRRSERGEHEAWWV